MKQEQKQGQKQGQKGGQGRRKKRTLGSGQHPPYDPSRPSWSAGFGRYIPVGPAQAAVGTNQSGGKTLGVRRARALGARKVDSVEEQVGKAAATVQLQAETAIANGAPANTDTRNAFHDPYQDFKKESEMATEDDDTTEAPVSSVPSLHLPSSSLIHTKTCCGGVFNFGSGLNDGNVCGAAGATEEEQQLGAAGAMEEQRGSDRVAQVALLVARNTEAAKQFSVGARVHANGSPGEVVVWPSKPTTNPAGRVCVRMDATGTVETCLPEQVLAEEQSPGTDEPQSNDTRAYSKALIADAVCSKAFEFLDAVDPAEKKKLTLELQTLIDLEPAVRTKKQRVARVKYVKTRAKNPVKCHKPECYPDGLLSNEATLCANESHNRAMRVYCNAACGGPCTNRNHNAPHQMCHKPECYPDGLLSNEATLCTNPNHNKAMQVRCDAACDEDCYMDQASIVCR